MFDDKNEIDPWELPIYKKGWEIYEVVNQNKDILCLIKRLNTNGY